MRKELNVAEVLRNLANWVASGATFYHVRFGDGELMSMYKMQSQSTTNGDGHNFFPDMGDSLLATFESICQQWREGRLSNLLIGSNNGTHPDANWTKRFVEHAKRLNCEHLPWTVGDFWWSPYEEVLGKGEILRLFKHLRDDNDVVLVCNNAVKGAAHALKANDVVLVPEKNAWLEYDRIFQECSRLCANRRPIFVWCSGMVGKVASWNLKLLHKQTSHIDMGHTFDGAFGVKSRTWLEGRDPVGAAHLKYCEEVFYPYIHKFLPKE